MIDKTGHTCMSNDGGSPGRGCDKCDEEQRKQRVAVEPVAVQIGTIEASGMALESAVRTEVGMGTQWELSGVQDLLLRMVLKGYEVVLYSEKTPAGPYRGEPRFVCDMAPATPDGTPPLQFIREYGNQPMTATGRAAVAAVRQWPDPFNVATPTDDATGVTGQQGATGVAPDEGAEA